MSLRIVAGDTVIDGASATWPEPTGWAVRMYSSTTAQRIAAFRSSSIGVATCLLRLALDDTECQRQHRGPPPRGCLRSASFVPGQGFLALAGVVDDAVGVLAG